MSIAASQARSKSQSPSPSSGSPDSTTNSNNSSAVDLPTTTKTGGSTTPTRVRTDVGPKHHIYPNTTPPKNPKYNPLPPVVTPESSMSQSQSQHFHQHSDSDAKNANSTNTTATHPMDDAPVDRIALLNAVAPPSLTLPPTLSLSSTTSTSKRRSHWYWNPQQSIDSSKHGSVIVSPSPSGWSASTSTNQLVSASAAASGESNSCEEIGLTAALALLDDVDVDGGGGKELNNGKREAAKEEGTEKEAETQTEEIPEGVGEYHEKSIAFGGGQALPFAIEEEEEPLSGDGTESSSFYTSTSAATSAAKSQPAKGKLAANDTTSSVAVDSGSKMGAGLSQSKSKESRSGSTKGRSSIRKRIKRLFSGSKGGFKAGDRVQI